MAKPTNRNTATERPKGAQYLPTQHMELTEEQKEKWEPNVRAMNRARYERATTAQEKAKAILSMSKEQQKELNQEKLQEALKRNSTVKPADPREKLAMARGFAKKELEEIIQEPHSSREARLRYEQEKREEEEWLAQYNAFLEQYGYKPSEEQIKQNPVLSAEAQQWKAWQDKAPERQELLLSTAGVNTEGMSEEEKADAAEYALANMQYQSFLNDPTVQEALKAQGFSIPDNMPIRLDKFVYNHARADTEGFLNAMRSSMEQARDRELEQLSEEDQAYVTNAYNRLNELYPQREELEAKGDTAGLAEVNRLIANEEKVLRDRGVALPGEVAEMAAAYGKNTKGDFDRYIKAVENTEEIDVMLEEAKERSPETYRTYLKAQNKVRRGLELTEEERSVYEGWSSMFGQKYEAEAEAKALEDGGVLEEGYSYTEKERMRRWEGIRTQVEELSLYAGTPQSHAAEQQSLKLMTELYNQRNTLQADIAAMERAGITGAALDNAKDQLETIERQITEGEYAMLRFEKDFAQKGALDDDPPVNLNNTYYLVNANDEERNKMMAYMAAGRSAAPGDSPVSGETYENIVRLDESERMTYNYIFRTEGADAAEKYLETIMPRLQRRVAQDQEEDWREFTSTPLGGVVGWVGARASTLLEGTGAIETFINNLQGKETSPYDPAFVFSRFKQTVDDQNKTNIINANGDGIKGKALLLGYDIASTFADSTIAMTAGKGVGKVLQGAGLVAQGTQALAKVGNSVGNAFMALSATTGKTREELLRGRDSNQALVQGLASGVMEALSEKMGMDKLTESLFSGKLGGYRTILSNMAKAFLPEALEEVPGNLVDRALDNYLNGGSSERAESIKQKIADNMNPVQAVLETDMEFILDTAQGALVSGVSGSLGAYVFSSVRMVKSRGMRRMLTEAGVDADTAQAAVERMAGLRSDAASEQAVKDAVEQLKNLEKGRGAKHTPFAAEATAAGYEDVPVKVTGFQGIRDGAAWVEVEIDGKGKGAMRLDQVQFTDKAMSAAYNRAAMFGDTQTARRFLAGYENTSLPLEIYGQAFQSAYQAGQNSRDMTKYEREEGFGDMLEDGVYRLAYQAGQEATAAQNARLAIPESLGKAIRRQLGQLPRTYTEGYTGVVYAAKNTQPTKAQAVMLSLLDEYAKAHGVHYTVVDSIGDGSANGVFTTSEGMVVALDAEEGYLTRVATHEGWHYIRQQMGQEAQDLQDVVLELLGNTEGYNLDSRVKEKQEQYKQIKGQELSQEAALEELTADALYDAMATPEALREFVSHAYENATSKRQKNAFVKTMDKVMDFVKRFVGEVKALGKKIAGKNPEARAMLEQQAEWGETIVQEYNRLMEEAGKREQGKDSDWYDYSKPFAQQVQDWIDGKIPELDTLLLGKTPELYRKIGLSNLPVTMNQTHVDYVINGSKDADHQIGIQLFKQLPQLLENPVAIIESGTRPGDSVMVIVQGTVHGKQICMPVWISGIGRQNKIEIDSNRVTSVYGKKNAVTKLLAEAIQKENAGKPSVYYINKTEARSLFGKSGVQFPGGPLQDGLIHSIFDAGSPVNRKFMEQTDTRQFKRWFGKSKVVNADGSPKVMYYGTNSGAFTESDPGHGGKNVQLDALGSGNYFTADRENARRQGAQVLEAYVSMQNPYIARSEGGLKRQMEREFGIKLASRRDIQGELQKRGYDGVILYEPGSDKEVQTAVAFEPTQIKSATDNVGTFDPQNPKINYSLRNGDVAQMQQEDALQGDTASETGELQAGENANDGENASSAENDDAQTENPYAYRVLTEKGDRTVVDVTDVGEITRDEAVQRGLENVRKYTDKTDHNGVPMMYVDDLGKYVTVGSKALRHGLDRRAQANSAVTAHIGDLLKQAIVINEADPKKENHTNTYILLSVARDSNQENVYVRMVVNQSTRQLEDITSLYALNTKKGARRVVAPNGEVSLDVPAGSTMTVAEILENVKDIYSDVLSKDVRQALGVEKRSESELTQRLRYSLRDGGTQAVAQGSTDALEGATVENHAGIYAAQREKLAGWADGKPRSAEAVRELLGESMTPTLEKWLHNQYEKGQNRQVKEPVRREAVEAFLKRDEEQIAANEEKSKEFWKKLRGEEVRVHEVEVGEHTHEGRGAMGRQIVQALMGDAPRVTVHNQDAQVDIYVNRASVEKTLSYGGSKNIPIEVSKAILLQTKEMLADAKYIGSRDDYTGNGGQVHYFVSAAQTGNEIRRVVYMAHETEGRSGSHLYVEEVELLDTENTGANDTLRPRFPAGAQPLTSNHPGTISIPELLQNYNTEFLRRYDLKERGAKRALQYSLREERTGVFTEIADRELREAGIDGRTARKAAERLGGLREDSAGNEALQAVKWRLWKVEREKRGSHTPFAARARVNGYEEEPVTVTGMKTMRNGEAYVEINGKGRVRLEQVRFRDKENEQVYREAARYERLKTARKFLGGYEAAGLPAELYGKAFRSAYDAGARSGRPGSRRRKLGYGGLLDVEVYRLAYEAGREESEGMGSSQ